jgi:catechol 2,3-dioxygenase-like lactoylglutathione lyase family enzyme
MHLGTILTLALLAAAAAEPQTGKARAAPLAERPAVTGISHLAVYTSDAAGADRFYGAQLGGRRAPDPEHPAGVRYHFSARQFVQVLPLPKGSGIDRLAHVAFTTTDAAGLRAWLRARGVESVSKLERGGDGSRWFSARDPEGNEVQFVQPATPDAAAEPAAISGRIIHVGFRVRDRAAQDAFYRDLLGFRPYWHGAMREGHVDWVSQQVPDGRDWLEYMMVGGNSTVAPERVDQRQLGVLNHFALGVDNMQAAVTRLVREERMSPRRDGPQIGRDGKWQANLYDPDGTRVELMEWHAVTRPCCSPFTAEDPEG